MTSKNLFFKLMKADLKSRLWAIALITLSCFFAYPVATVFMAGDIARAGDLAEGIASFQEKIIWWLSAENGFTVFGMCVAAVICGLSSFSYLYSKNKVDFFHSIPVKREKLYLTNLINGILILFVPYAICQMLAVIIATTNGANGGMLLSSAGFALVFHMIYFMLMYSVVILAVMLTGNMVISFLGYMVILFFIPMAVVIQQAYFSAFFDSYQTIYAGDLANHGTRLSPMMEYIYQLAQCYENRPMAGALLLGLAVTVVIMGIGCILYKKRASETAGKAMVFSVSKPIIRILISFLCAMSVGLFFWALNSSNGWAVFGIFCGGIISHCIIEIIFHFDFKKLFAHKIQMIICTIVAMVLFFGFRYDWMGYDAYVPPIDKIKEASVDLGSLNQWVSYGKANLSKRDNGYTWENMDGCEYVFSHMHDSDDLEEIREIAAAGIKYLEESKVEPDYYMGGEEAVEAVEGSGKPAEIDAEESDMYTRVSICYTLNSGRKVYRSYYMPVKDILVQLDGLYSSKQFLEGTYPLFTRKVEEIINVSYIELGEATKLYNLTKDEKQQLLETYTAEFASLTPERMTNEAPVGIIRFTTYEHEAGIQAKLKEYENKTYVWEVEYFEEKDYYPIYPSFANTIALLKKQGIPAGDGIKNLDIKKIYIDSDSLAETGAYTTRSDEISDYLVIDDPDEVSILQPLMVKSEMTYYNPLFKCSEVTGEIRGKDMMGEENEHLYVVFPFNKIPDFVKEKLQ